MKLLVHFYRVLFITTGFFLFFNISIALADCSECIRLDGYVQESEVDDEIRHLVGKYKGGAGPKNVAIQKARGVIETGLEPRFIDGANCPTIDSEQWAIDYTSKRHSEALHRGVDIPQPFGTPILAVADGMVVGKFLNEGNRKGIEINLRHSPQQTGLPFWTYSQYTHLQELPNIPIGANVTLGEVIAKTSNTGLMGVRERRHAVHFAVLYSTSPNWSNDGVVVAPKDAYFMDPNAFYKNGSPYDSQSLAKLSADQKIVPVPYMKSNGSKVPPNTKRIWPYACQ